jgi:branched-chain amino acid transport system permease protein
MAALRPSGDFDRTYEHDMSIIRKPWQWVLLGIAIIAALTVPQWGSAYLVTTVNQIAITVIALQGLNILTGYTGQISLGQAAFMLIGGYISGLLSIHAGFPIYFAIPFAALGTGAVGLLFGLPSLRVKGFYLAMATLAAQFIIPWLSRHTFPDLLGGSSGRIDVPVPTIGSFAFDQVNEFIFISFAVLIVTTLLTLNITRTRLGRAFVSVHPASGEQISNRLRSTAALRDVCGQAPRRHPSRADSFPPEPGLSRQGDHVRARFRE